MNITTELIDKAIAEVDRRLWWYRLAARGGVCIGAPALLALFIVAIMLVYRLFTGGLPGIQNEMSVLILWIAAASLTVVTLVSFAFYRFGVPGIQRAEAERAGLVYLKITLSEEDQIMRSMMMSGFVRCIYPGCDPGIFQATAEAPSM